MNNFKSLETIAIHGGYSPEQTTKSTAAPIYMTNAYNFDSTQHAADLFSLSQPGNIYTRLMNPTSDILEKRIAALDGGIGALAFASGHAAIFNTIICLANAGDHIVSSSKIYGGAINLLGVTLKNLGIQVTFIDPDDLGAWESAIQDNTKAFFYEVIGNPNANIIDMEAVNAIAQKHKIITIVDATFTTPYLCRPIEFGANIVIHSATKYLGGNGTAMAGIVVDAGTFVFKGNSRYPLYNQPDESYHGVVFAELGSAAFVSRLRVLIMRDIGACLSPFNAAMILYGVETLHVRMERHCENALKVANYLEQHPQVATVNYPTLDSSPYKVLQEKYMPKGASGVFTFELKGGRQAGATFIDSLQLLSHVANVGDIRSLVVHPASTTHSQLSKEQLIASGITEGTIRLSIGLEHIQDILADLEQALESSANS